MPSDYDYIFANFTHAEWVEWYRMGLPFPSRIKPATGDWYVHDKRLATAPSKTSLKVAKWRRRKKREGWHDPRRRAGRQAA